MFVEKKGSIFLMDLVLWVTYVTSGLKCVHNDFGRFAMDFSANRDTKFDFLKLGT